MLTVNDVYEYINTLAPFDTQMSYDNSGLVLGNKYMGVSKIMVALDITADVAYDAEEFGADLIVTHHPPIFRALKKIDTATPVGILLADGVSVISAHTNFDSAKGGMNDILCEKLGLRPCESLSAEEGVPCGYVCTADEIITAKAWAERIKNALGCSVVRYNDMGGEIEKIAVCSGSGGGFLEDVIAHNCDAYITGDVKHDVFIDAFNSGITVFDAGHFHTEDIFAEFICKKLKETFPEAECVVAPSDRDILSYEI